MGCTCSSENSSPENDIVGGVGRTTNMLKEEELPEERKPMVALEVAASRQTKYRRKVRKYKSNLDLDYNSNKDYNHLRNLLDEPLGIFYLFEFAQEKELPDAKQVIHVWLGIDSFTGLRNLPLDEILELAKQQDEAIAPEAKEEHETLMNTIDFFAQNPSSDTKVVETAKYILEILSDMSKFCSEESLLKACRQDLESGIVENNANKIRNAVNPRKLQNRLFLYLIENGIHEKFLQHSEYKRYKFKFSKVYNTISHRDFDFMHPLGKGSFGRVLRVRKKTSGAQYALKVMSKQKILSGAESAEQVTIERNVLVQCTSPSIVRTLFCFQTSRALFLALECLEGGTLVEGMRLAGGAFDQQQTSFIVGQIILGLEHLHKHGILYRDLKPANVMLDRFGNAVLTDMGLCAKFRDSEFPKEHGAISNSGQKLSKRKSMSILKPEDIKCVGTYGFRAPEVLIASDSDAGYGPPVDYWALGVTTFYLMYGNLPFSKKPARASGILGPQTNPKVIEKKMHKEPLCLPRDIEPDTKSLVDGLLCLDAEKRLGNNVDELKSHPFFSGLDFEKLDNRELKPVYRPKFDEYPDDETPQFSGLAEAMTNFAHDNVLELFGGENEMQDEYSHVGRSNQKLFREWDFVPDSLLEPEWRKEDS